MLVTHIIGGLGNQMFQYAVGRALALQRDCPLLLDISGFSDYGLHQGFELQRVFDCHAKIANERQVRRVLGWQFPPLVRRMMARPVMAALRRNTFVVEPHFQYWGAITQVPSDGYLMGYWQSEKYFQSHADIIRGDFSFKQPLSPKNTELANQIAKVTAVSLHVRRGDYVNNPITTATHGLCSLDYYRDAIRYVASHTLQPHFFVFSDDIAWVKEKLPIDFPHRYVNHNHGAESYNDMRLMSMCKHHIIANSSFSWWGAWLNPNVNKIVVAPQRWFANQNDVLDLLPQNWVRM